MQNIRRVLGSHCVRHSLVVFLLSVISPWECLRWLLSGVCPMSLCPVCRMACASGRGRSRWASTVKRPQSLLGLACLARVIRLKSPNVELYLGGGHAYQRKVLSGGDEKQRRLQGPRRMRMRLCGQWA